MTLKDAFFKYNQPNPGELWLINDDHAVMDEPENTQRKVRPAVILFNAELKNRSVWNVLPCSTAVPPGRMHVPVNRGLTDMDTTYNFSDKSCACIHLYQPLNDEAFVRKIGRLEFSMYSALVNSLCHDLIGSPQFDISI